MAECGAKTRDGKRCKVAAMPNGRCYRHGGATPSGVACVNTKHGRFGKHMPERMVADYKQSHNDDDKLSVDGDIDMLFARQCDVLGRVDTGESGEMWRSLLSSLKEVKRCRKLLDRALLRGDRDEIREAGRDLCEALDSMELLAQGGVSDYAAWREVKDLSEALRKLRETETKRRVAQQEMVTRQKAEMMLGKVLMILRTHIPDRKTLGDVSADLRRLVAITASE